MTRIAAEIEYHRTGEVAVMEEMMTSHAPGSGHLAPDWAVTALETPRVRVRCRDRGRGAVTEVPPRTVMMGLRDERGRDVPGARLPPERRAQVRTERGRQRRAPRLPRAARAVDLPGRALSEMPALRPLCLRHRLMRCLRLEVPALMR